MRFVRRMRLPAHLLGAAVLLAIAPARADITKAQCIEANTKGQDLLHDGRLTAARAQLQSCAVASCPKVIRGDCTRRVEELETMQPAIVFEAKDAAGNDLSAVSITMDGAPLVEKLDGTLLRVDPGEHVFVLTTAGSPPVTKKLVLVERDQSRKERVVFAAPAPVPPPVAPVPPAPARASETSEAHVAPPASGGMSTLRLLGLVSGGVGIVGIGVGSAFGVMAGSALSSQRSACASPASCANHPQAVSDHSTFTTDGAVSTAGFVAGGVLLAAGVVLFFAGGKKAESGATTGLIVSPAISPGGAGLIVNGAF
jgi:hypothetical protein